MPYAKSAAALLAALSAVSAVHARPAPEPLDQSGNPDTRYCMRVAPLTGSRIETVRCWTRQEWADQGVDLAKEWPREGVRILR